jgi:hypothetical protein
LSAAEKRDYAAFQHTRQPLFFILADFVPRCSLRIPRQRWQPIGAAPLETGHVLDLQRCALAAGGVPDIQQAAAVGGHQPARAGGACGGDFVLNHGAADVGMLEAEGPAEAAAFGFVFVLQARDAGQAGICTPA